MELHCSNDITFDQNNASFSSVNEASVFLSWFAADELGDNGLDVSIVAEYCIMRRLKRYNV